MIISSKPHHADPSGEQVLHRFDNNYGASVIRFQHSYGGPEGLWELAVIKFNSDDKDSIWRLVYDTPITDDVLGYLTDKDVAELLNQIEALPKAS